MALHPAKCPRCGGRLEYESAVDEKIVCPSCQALLSVPGKHKLSDKVDPLIGQTLGEFEVVELLGRGGMGAVYKARQPSLNRFVALKVLPRAVSRDAAFIERFSREAHAAAAVNHPNIIQIYAVGQDKGFHYIAMELVEGESLSDILKVEGRLGPERAVAIIKQVAAALGCAHAAGIVHRDIKPGNILVRPDGLVKVADFGLAKRPGSDMTVTATGASLGTPLYFPPEVARGEQADARSDLYSLGATFYHLIAGRPPFQGASMAELAIKHANDPVPPLRQAAPDAPAALCGIIQRLLRKNPSERYQSANDLLEALERLDARGAATLTMPAAGRGAAGGASAARGSLAERRQAKAQGRRKLLILGGVAAAIALVVVVVLALRRGPQDQAARVPQPTTALAPRSASTLTPGSEHPTPDSAAERNAEIVFRNAQTMAARADWEQARAYLERLESKYGQTRYVGANRAAIEALSKELQARLRPVAPPPKPEPKKEEPPKPQPKQEEPKPKEKEKATAKEDEDARKRQEEQKRREAEAKSREEAEARFAEAMKPIEALVAAWDFAAALDALSKLNLPQVLEPAGGYAERLATRRDELERLTKLKARFIAKIASAQPPLDKRSLLLTGMNGPIVKADDKAITAKPMGTERTETHEWPSLSPKTIQKLLDITLDKASADDWLTAGILLLSCT